MIMSRKPVERDARDFDTTSLHERAHGRNLHRDYSAHFFRWSFARHFIEKTHDVLEVGCGVEKPLARVLLSNAWQQVNHYTGVDLSPLTATGTGKRATFHGEFNVVTRWRELLKERPHGYDVLIHLEVIEHMRVDHGRALLKACYQLLKPGGVMLMSTPCYDGSRHAANHIHEYTVPELRQMVEKAGFVVERRFGTFMDTRHIGRADPDPDSGATREAIANLKQALGAYYDRDALSCFFAPLFPDHARNNLWVCRRPL